MTTNKHVTLNIQTVLHGKGQDSWFSLFLFSFYLSIYFDCCSYEESLSNVILWTLVAVQGGGEAKTLTPKQCIIIDAGLESIKVGEDLHVHMPEIQLVNVRIFIWFFSIIKICLKKTLRLKLIYASLYH